jgi:hypothetical protein
MSTDYEGVLGFLGYGNMGSAIPGVACGEGPYL